jgi:hypothetical protein
MANSLMLGDASMDALAMMPKRGRLRKHRMDGLTERLQQSYKKNGGRVVGAVGYFPSRIESGGVGERFKPAVLKTKSPIRYLVQNSIKSLCQPRDSENFSFLDLLRFSPFYATFSDNLVTVEGGSALTH